MNKKILILAGVFIVLLGVSAYMYMDQILVLFGIGKEEPVQFATPAKPKQDPVDIMKPEKLLEKTMEKSQTASLGIIGYKDLQKIETFKYNVAVNLKLSKDLLKPLPKNLQKFENIDLKFSIAQNILNSNIALNVESSLLKKIFASVYNGSISVILPESKEIYACSAADLKAMGIPIEQFGFSSDEATVKTPAAGDNKTEDAEEDDEEGDAVNKDEAKGGKEDKKAEDTAESKKNEKSSENPIIDRMLKIYSLSKSKAGAQIKLTFTPKNETPSAIPVPVIHYYINKKTFMIEKVEQEININGDKIVMPTEIKYDNDKPIKITGEYGNKDFKNTYELQFKYADNLINEIAIVQNGQEVGVLLCKYSEDKKLNEINFEKDIDGNFLKIALTDIKINEKLEESDFTVEGADSFKKKTQTDLIADAEKKDFAKKFLKDDLKLLTQLGQNISTSIISKMIAGKGDLALVNTEEGSKKGEKTEVKDNKAGKSEDEEEGDEEEKTSKKESAPVKSKKPPVKTSVKVSAAPKQKAEAAEEAGDEEEAEEKPEQKSKTEKTVKNEPAPVKQKKVKQSAGDEEGGEQPQPSGESLMMVNSEKSAKFGELVRKYQIGKTTPAEIFEEAKSVISAEPENVEALYIAGIICFQNLKDKNQANNYFDRVIKIKKLDSKISKQIYYWSRQLRKQ